MSNSKNEPLTKEQIKEQKDKALEFYTEELKYLRVEKEYETLVAEISEARVKQIMFDRKIVELMVQEQEMMKNAEEASKTPKKQ